MNLSGAKRHLFRIPRQRSHEDIDVYVWLILLSTKDASLLGVCLPFYKHSPNICSKSCMVFSASCVSPYTHDVATLPTSMHNKHERTHTHTNLFYDKSVKSLMFACKHPYMCEKLNIFQYHRVPMKTFAFLSYKVLLLLWLKLTMTVFTKRRILNKL